MAVFNTLSKTEADGLKPLAVSIDVGRTLAGVGLGGIALLAALILYLVGEDPAAALFFALGEAIAVGVLGLAYGENAGARSASDEIGR